MDLHIEESVYKKFKRGQMSEDEYAKALMKSVEDVDGDAEIGFCKERKTLYEVSSSRRKKLRKRKRSR